MKFYQQKKNAIDQAKYNIKSIFYCEFLLNLFGINKSFTIYECMEGGSM